MDEKFLMVYAVFDHSTQKVLGKLGQKLLEAGISGSQTNDVEYHISLGSYPVSKVDEVIKLIQRTADNTTQFEVQFDGLSDFGNNVLFIQPKHSNEIFAIREIFDNDYPIVYDYHPHCTLLIDNSSNVQKAREILQECDLPRKATVTELHLGQFFPTNVLFRCSLKKQ